MPEDIIDDVAVVDPALAKAKQELFDKAKKDGHVDQRDIFKAIPDTPDNVDLLDVLYTELADSGIGIVSGTEPNAAEFTDEWVAEDEEEIKLDEQVYMDDIADDSVRLYLREIGKIPLLTSAEELALAQRVVAGDKDAKDKMAEANKAFAHFAW